MLRVVQDFLHPPYKPKPLNNPEMTLKVPYKGPSLSPLIRGVVSKVTSVCISINVLIALLRTTHECLK